jgi:hypothetical protein
MIKSKNTRQHNQQNKERGPITAPSQSTSTYKQGIKQMIHLSITSGLILLQQQKANSPEIRAWLQALYIKLAEQELFSILPEAAAAFPLPQDLE